MDICCVTETWLQGDDTDRISTGQLTPTGYSLLHVPRGGKKNGGGVAVIYKSGLNLRKQSVTSYRTFEHMEVLFTLHNTCVRICVLYRPPSGSTAAFLDDFSRLADGHATTTGQLVLLGDFNLHYDSKQDSHTQRFSDMMDAMDLHQRVEEQTHDKGHTLDLVITRKEEADLVNNLEVCPLSGLDHYSISFTMPFKKPEPERKTTKSRNIKNIDIDQLSEDVTNSKLVQDPPTDLNELVLCYNSTLRSLFDKHAPVTEKEVILRPNAPWYNESIKQAKQERRKAERKWAKSKLTIDKEILKQKQKSVNDICDKEKETYYNEKIKAAENDSKSLFRLSNLLLEKKNEKILPTHKSEKELASNFGKYFSDKIENVRTQLGKNEQSEASSSSIGVPLLTTFKEISEKDLAKVILNGNSKSCDLDPMPTALVKSLLDVLLPTIHKIVNRSLKENIMPTALKEAIVKPLIKKPHLDKEDLKNFRPVSNLPFLGKVIEQVAIDQIEKHLTSHHLHETLQSAYTPNHSTETAMVKVTNDILLALDKRQCAYLVLLDLSAAFDTIDHKVFLSRLQEDYGVTGSVKDWMESYLSDRHQSIDINGTFSEKIKLHYGFPQGSKIGPFGFKLYTKPLSSIAKKYNIQIHLYADDTQLYCSFDPDDSVDAMNRMEECIAEIKSWMEKNFLKLNDSKTEFIIFGTKNDMKRLSEWTVSVGEDNVLPSEWVKDIGVMLDPTLSMNTQINSIVKSCYFQMRNLSKIRKYLSEDAAKALTHAFVSSRLDNMNSLLANIPDYQIHKLQLIQNHAARIIKKQKKSCHITPILIDLHWLPIQYRIQYKILLLVYKCIHGESPVYLSSLVQEHQPSRALRSGSQQLLRELPVRKNYGKRAFSVVGPKLWNLLPFDIKMSTSVNIFKSALKTHLFKCAYDL